MADILIRGMEMPHDCPHCAFAAIGYVSPMSSDCTLYCRAVDKFKDCATAVLKDKPYEVINRYNDRPGWCPLVPLPEGHGDLIEQKALNLFPDYKEVRNGIKRTIKEAERDGRAITGVSIDLLKQTLVALDSLRSVRRYFLNAKPIVPAEGGGENG